ncbi:MAG: hypothetical protein U0271_23315 [Polyangiaceae bacterium]
MLQRLFPAVCVLTILSSFGCAEVRVETTESNPPVDPPDPQSATFCASSVFSGTSADAVAIAQAPTGELSLLFRDGHLSPLDLELPTLPAGATPWATAQAGGDVIVVTAGWVDAAPEFSGHYFTRWFSRRGELLERIDSVVQHSPSGVGADGTSVVFRYDYATSIGSYLVRLPDGQLVEDIPFQPQGLPLADGWLFGTTDGGLFSFFDPRTQEVRVIADIDPSIYPTFDARGVYFVRTIDGVGELVFDSPEGRSMTALGELGDDLAYILEVNAAGYALVALVDPVDGSERDLRVDLQSGEIVAIDAAPPAGMIELANQCGFQRRHLASDGSVIVDLRIDGDAREGLFDPVSGEWTLVAQPVANPGSFSTREVGGTFLVAANDGSQSYCPPITWDAPPSAAALPIESFQIARPVDDSNIVLEMSDGYWFDVWSVTLTNDGACGFYVDEDGAGHLLDVASGAATDLDETQTLTFIP